MVLQVIKKMLIFFGKNIVETITTHPVLISPNTVLICGITYYPVKTRKRCWNTSVIKPGPDVIKLFPCSTQLSMKF